MEERIAYHSKLLANVNDVIIGADEHFITTFWNPAAAKIFGWTVQEVIGKPTAEVLKTEFKEADRTESIRVLIEHGDWVGEVVKYTKDGRPLIFEANILTLYQRDDRVVGFVSANRDITQRRRAERDLDAQIEDPQQHL